MACACAFAASFMLSSPLWVAVSRNRSASGRVAVQRPDPSQARISDALENLFAPYPAAGNQSASPCDDSSRTDKASRPVGRHVAIRCPVPRALKDHLRASNDSYHIIRNSRTRTRCTTDENSREFSRRIDTQHLQHAAPLTLPNRGGQALRRSG